MQILLFSVGVSENEDEGFLHWEGFHTSDNYGFHPFIQIRCFLCFAYSSSFQPSYACEQYKPKQEKDHKATKKDEHHKKTLRMKTTVNVKVHSAYQ